MVKWITIQPWLLCDGASSREDNSEAIAKIYSSSGWTVVIHISVSTGGAMPGAYLNRVQKVARFNLIFARPASAHNLGCNPINPLPVRRLHDISCSKRKFPWNISVKWDALFRLHFFREKCRIVLSRGNLQPRQFCIVSFRLDFQQFVVFSHRTSLVDVVGQETLHLPFAHTKGFMIAWQKRRTHTLHLQYRSTLRLEKRHNHAYPDEWTECEPLTWTNYVSLSQHAIRLRHHEYYNTNGVRSFARTTDAAKRQKWRASLYQTRICYSRLLRHTISDTTFGQTWICWDLITSWLSLICAFFQVQLASINLALHVAPCYHNCSLCPYDTAIGVVALPDIPQL